MTALKKDLDYTDKTKIALLEKSIEHINESLIKLDRTLDLKFSLIDKRFDSIDKRFEAMDSKMEKGFSECRQLSWGHFRWIMGTVIICILVPLVKGFTG